MLVSLNNMLHVVSLTSNILQSFHQIVYFQFLENHHGICPLRKLFKTRLFLYTYCIGRFECFCHWCAHIYICCQIVNVISFVTSSLCLYIPMSPFRRTFSRGTNKSQKGIPSEITATLTIYAWKVNKMVIPRVIHFNSLSLTQQHICVMCNINQTMQRDHKNKQTEITDSE